MQGKAIQLQTRQKRKACTWDHILSPIDRARRPSEQEAVLPDIVMPTDRLKTPAEKDEKEKAADASPVIPVAAALSVHCRGQELVISPTKHY
jgi:hypothetical protein